jgi:hypothetical protein
MWFGKIRQRLRITVRAVAQEKVQLDALADDLLLKERRQHDCGRTCVLHVLEFVDVPPERIRRDN